jgi:hypothetical protein
MSNWNDVYEEEERKELEEAVQLEADAKRSKEKLEEYLVQQLVCLEEKHVALLAKKTEDEENFKRSSLLVDKSDILVSRLRKKLADSRGENQQPSSFAAAAAAGAGAGAGAGARANVAVAAGARAAGARANVAVAAGARANQQNTVVQPEHGETFASVNRWLCMNGRNCNLQVCGRKHEDYCPIYGEHCYAGEECTHFTKPHMTIADHEKKKRAI